MSHSRPNQIAKAALEKVQTSPDSVYTAISDDPEARADKSTDFGPEQTRSMCHATRCITKVQKPSKAAQRRALRT